MPGKRTNRLVTLWCIAALLLPAAAQAATPATGQQRRQSQPVVELRRVLAGVFNAKAREDALKLRVGALTLPSDLRDALGLLEWRDSAAEFSDPNIVRIDRQSRTAIATKLRDELRSFLKSGNADVELAALRMIGEIGTTVRGASPAETFASTLAPDLEAIALQNSDPRIAAAAAHALGKVYPRQDPVHATAALGKLLQSNNAQVRRAAAQGLSELAHTALELVKAPTTTGGLVSSTVRAEDLLADLTRIDSAVVNVAADGLANTDPDVRFLSLSAIRDALNTVVQALPPPKQPGEGRPPTIFLPVIQALNQHAPLIARTLTDPRADIRELAAKTLVDLSVFRRNLLYGSPRQPVAPPAPRRGPTVGPRVGLDVSRQVAASDPATAVRVVQNKPLPAPRPVETTSAGEVLQTFRKLFPAMHTALRDPNFSVRLQTVEALEMLATEASSFAPDLARAMHDPNLFVRWASARTLGEMGPLPQNVPANAATVTGFLHLIANPIEDVDVRLAASTALERWGPDALDPSVAGTAAQQVVPVLSRRLSSGDPEVRIGLLQALEATRTGAPEAIQAIIGELSGPDKRVRVQAAAALGILANNTPAVQNALTRALYDTDEDVRREASAALLDITQRSRR